MASVQREGRESLCIESPAPPCGVVILGASGDLAHRKLIPSLFRLGLRGLLPDGFFILGVARTAWDDAAFRAKIRDSLTPLFPGRESAAALDAFLESCFYLSGNYVSREFLEALARRLQELHRRRASRGNTIFYLSIPPFLYRDVIEQLARHGLAARASGGEGWRRVVVEKPFGRDYASAVELDEALHRYLREDQIYRIDHYLGKETVQNILMLRFANTVFEPLWNHRYIHHVQITVAESVGVGHRAGYYESAGCLRDMFQNHMLQLLSLVAMEPPTSFDADRVRDEKAKLLRSVRPFSREDVVRHVVRGQYAGGVTAGKTVPGYREEPGVAADSATETFVALRLLVDNWRWTGVPFYLRSGKRLRRRVSEIAISFQPVPHSIFRPLRPEDLTPNVLVLNVQPEEGVALTIHAKKPGPKLCMGRLTLDFRYRDVFGGEPPEAYERLLLDCMQGDQTLFAREDNIRLAWELLEPILETWESARPEDPRVGLHPYPAGSWGPAAAERLPEIDGVRWLLAGE